MTQALLHGSIRNSCPQIKPGVGTQPAWSDRFPLFGLGGRWFNADCVSAHEGVRPLWLPPPGVPQITQSTPAMNRTAISCRRFGLRSAVAELAQENPQSRSYPEMPTRIVTWHCRIIWQIGRALNGSSDPRAPWLRRGPLLWPRHFLCFPPNALVLVASRPARSWWNGRSINSVKARSTPLEGHRVIPCDSIKNRP